MLHLLTSSDTFVRDNTVENYCLFVHEN